MVDKVKPENHIPICSEVHVVLACELARALAAELGLSQRDQAGIHIATKEVAHNIIRHAQQGEIIVRSVQRDSDGQWGVSITARDAGPGIPDIEKAAQDGYSTAGSLGLGLPGARRLMDEFEIRSRPGQGTVVSMTKWKQ